MTISKIFGIHAVQAALDHSSERIKRVWLAEHRQDKKFLSLLDQLKRQAIIFEESNQKKLDRISSGKNHQGIIAEVELPSVHSEQRLKHWISQSSEKPFFLILDQVQDPHNLGACLRTADAAGVQGVIITKDNATSITPVVCKVACGATETIPVYQVTNLARTLRWLKQQNIWVIGTAGEASQSVFTTDLTVPLVLVMGTEGTGMRRLTREQCDLLVQIPMQGQVESLNISVAAGIMMYEAFRQRHYL